MYFNILELRAVHLAYQAFLPLIWSRHIQLFFDNIAAVVDINNQGSAKSSSLCSSSIPIWNWFIKHQVTLQAMYFLCAKSSDRHTQQDSE